MRNQRNITWAVLSVGAYFLFSAPFCFASLEALPVKDSSLALEGRNFDQRISIDLNDMNTADVLRYLGDKAGINIAVSKNIEGRVTLSFKDVSIRDALEIALLSNDLAIEKRGDILYVSLADDFQSRYGHVWGDARKLRMFKLNYARPSDVLKVLDKMRSSVGNIVVNDETGMVVLMDTLEKLDQMQAAIDNMDREALTKVFELKYARADNVEASLTGRLEGKGIGTIEANDPTNKVVVTALPGRMEEVEKIIKELDTKTRQVLIEAKIVKVSLSPDFDMGINWDFIQRRSRRHQISTSHDFQVPSTISSLGSLTLGTLSTDDYEGTLSLLKTVGETKLLSSPRIAALNNEEASILVGTREAYVTQTITQGDTTTTTAENVTFVDVGVKFNVTPSINDDGFVTIRIRPEVSSVARSLTTASGNTVPIVDTTTAETTVMVKDGTTIIIGGLIKDETLRTTRKVPWLGDIPLVGTLFKSINEDKEKTELVVFLTPKIIEGDENQKSWEEKVPKGLRGYDTDEAQVMKTSKLEMSKPIRFSGGGE